MEAVARGTPSAGASASMLGARREAGRAKDGGPLVTTPDPAIDAFRMRLDVAVGGGVQPLDENALACSTATRKQRTRRATSTAMAPGFSLSFGDLPAGAPSEHGVGGLRLAFLTRLGRLVASTPA